MASIRDSYNDCDDFIAYFQIAKKFLQAGHMDDPFSVRRISALGGQSYFHALLLTCMPIFHIHLFERGICDATVVLLILGHAKQHVRQSRATIVLLSVYVITLTCIRINTASTMSGTVFFLGMFRSLDFSLLMEPTQRRSRGLLLALPSAAICTLRQNYMLPVGIFLIATFGNDFARSKGARRPILKEAAWALAGFAVPLLPWALAAVRSSNTCLFPVVPGNYNVHFNMLQATAPLEVVRFALANVAYCEPTKTLPLFILAGLLGPESSPRRPVKSLIAASMFGIIGLAKGFPLSDPGSIARYYFGFVTTTVIAIGLSIQQVSPRRSRSGWATCSACGVVVLVALALQIQWTFRDAVDTVSQNLIAIRDEAASHNPFPSREVPDADIYHALQSHIPVGQSMLTMTDNPYFFDFRRNDIMNVDTPGAAGPGGRFPMFGGSEVFVTYLLKQHIRYFSFVLPTTSRRLYNRGMWETHLHGSNPLWSGQAPFYLQLMTVVEELAKTRRRLYDDGYMVAVDLMEPSGIGKATP